jgi:hypothetical protein
MIDNIMNSTDLLELGVKWSTTTHGKSYNNKFL